MIDVICGFQRAESGTVRVDGRPIDNLSPSARALIGLSRSFQSLELFEDMTVIENLRVSQGGYKRIHYLSDLVWPHSTSLNQSIVAAIDRFQLGPMLDLLPSQLDYAHRRLVAIARALSIEPSILFLDEPAAGLDENERREFVEMLRYLSASHGFGILLVEHDVDLVFRVCNRVVALDAGRVIAEGDPATLRDDPALVASYLGSSENDAEVSDVVK
jgi:sulfate-transporting ATPase